MKITSDLFDEMEVTAWILIAALLAFVLMFGHSIWTWIVSGFHETTPGSAP